MKNNKPQTTAEALTLALTLAITAPTDQQATDCVAMADSLAAQLSDSEVEACKAAAKAAADMSQC